MARLASDGASTLRCVQPLLFAVFWIPGFLYALWVIVASVLLTREPRVSAAAIPQPA